MQLDYSFYDQGKGNCEILCNHTQPSCVTSAIGIAVGKG